MGRLVERREDDGSVERWEYDAEGNEVLYVDGDGCAHRKEYASWNLLHREINPAGNGYAFQYSPTEELTQFVDEGGAVHEFVYDKYDKDGRIAKRRAPGKLEGSFYYDIKQALIERFQAAD